MMEESIIILPTHSDYKDVVCNFLQLLQKNWPNCPYKIVISVTGEKIDLEDYETEYNGKDSSLIECLVNAVKKHKANNYLVFLGDAFIAKKIDEQRAKELLKMLPENKIEYCSLNYVRRYKKERKLNEFFRLINEQDRYSHSFVAFFASRDYINNIMSKFKSDLDFETYYLRKKNNRYYKNHAIVRENYFNILPSITKGKWDRLRIRKLIKENPEIYFAERPIQTRKEAAVYHIRNAIVSYLPDRLRIAIKKAAGKCLKYEFGVVN